TAGGGIDQQHAEPQLIAFPQGHLNHASGKRLRTTTQKHHSVSAWLSQPRASIAADHDHAIIPPHACVAAHVAANKQFTATHRCTQSVTRRTIDRERTGTHRNARAVADVTAKSERTAFEAFPDAVPAVAVDPYIAAAAIAQGIV